VEAFSKIRLFGFQRGDGKNPHPLYIKIAQIFILSNYENVDSGN